MSIEYDAVLSECQQYRYVLMRSWDQNTKPLLPFIMLNPSIADAKVDDATIRVCMGRARLMDYGGIIVLNLFAYRATQPAELLRVPDPVGPDNDEWLDWLLAAQPPLVIAAWGAHGTFKNRAHEVTQICRRHGTLLYCLGTTQDGQPKHPLRVAYSIRPMRWTKNGHKPGTTT